MMTRFLLCCSLMIASLNIFAQDTTRRLISTGRASTTRMPLDTNQVMYDEQGNALRYYQFTRLMNTGDYTYSTPISAGGKRVLRKMTAEEKNIMFTRAKISMAPKTAALQEGKELDTSPLNSVVRNAELENKVIVLIFWATGCPPCTDSFADVNDILKQIHNPEDVVVLAITRDLRNVATAKLKEKPLLYAQLISNAGYIFNAYQLSSYPTYVVTDKSHMIRYAITGSAAVTIPMLRNTIQAVLYQ